jgi:phosphoglycolate phosphatase
VIKAIVFDKDGTLLDFEATWNEAVGAAFDQISDVHARETSADMFGYDLASRTVLPHSPFVSESNDVVMGLVNDLIDVETFERTINQISRLNVVPSSEATATLKTLVANGVKLAIATNDSEGVARHHVSALGWTQLFTSVKGCGATPGSYLMVGDSVHDILAGQAAGATTVAIGNNQGALSLADHKIKKMTDLIALVKFLQQQEMNDSTNFASDTTVNDI